MAEILKLSVSSHLFDATVEAALKLAAKFRFQTGVLHDGFIWNRLLAGLALGGQFWTSVEMAHMAHKPALGCGSALILEMDVEVLVIELLATV